MPSKSPGTRRSCGNGTTTVPSNHSPPSVRSIDMSSTWTNSARLWWAECAFTLLLCASLSVLAAAPVAPEHWAFQPVQRPTIPAPGNRKSETGNQIDAFILARLGERQLAPPADKRTLIRRATFDLIGLPPTPEEVEAFLADTSKDAFAKVVDRLLASPHYGEHWGRHWLDVVRYADTAGETADYPVPVAWRYRNYVIDAFNADKPYDEFLREQIAGDILARQGPREQFAERMTATGYLAISRRFGFDSENYNHLTIQDTLDTLGQSVLGLSLGCARCHDHKYDPVTMHEYYALYGIFDSTRYAFPGSEQKQKYRSMAPLRPGNEADADWREFDARIAAMVRKLEKHKQPSPTAVLRSLADMDGDFEMQAIAAGGSRGVLVPPWIYEGTIAVTREAQSPFGNLYPLGKAGATLPSGTNHYQFGQALHPARSHEAGGRLFVNVDFRVATNAATATGRHRFWMGSHDATPSPAFEILVSQDSLSLRNAAGDLQLLAPVQGAAWHNLQFTLDLDARTIAGEVSASAGSRRFDARPLLPKWNGSLDYVGVASEASDSERMPGLDIDNIGVRDTAILSLVAAAEKAGEQEPILSSLTDQIQRLAGIDGDFELQSADTPPAKPWGPRPNSAVKISAQSQSPYRHIHGSGELGIRLPPGPAYNGFGQTLTNAWKAAKTGRLHASFDFRYTTEANAAGSWRYYLGHGPGSSAAVELFISDGQFTQRSGDARSAVAPLRAGEWYHVQFALDLKEKNYTGWIGTPSERTEFRGSIPTGWDGTIDYTFIDSYGHLSGVRPALDSDNFTISETPLPGFEAKAVESLAEGKSKREKVAALRRQLAGVQADLDKTRRELEAALAEGPSELAYAVVEGTPHNARIQMRGDRDQPGAEVPRGFIRALGGGELPREATGSGRLELAQWLTRPDNPLTARVMVNRIWQYHFGRGLVATPNDFGRRGQPPTHPELLDYLATRFVAGGWSVKAMHRLIMASAVYQQSSVAADVKKLTSTAAKKDQSLLTSAATSEGSFSPFPRRRLTAEQLRDSILFVSGELDREPGRGHTFPSPTGWGFTQHAPFSAVYDHNKRSVYIMTQRLKRHPFLALFDGPDPNASTATRTVSTVPTQALYFMNSSFVHEKAEKFSRKLERASASNAERIDLAYAEALGRPPSEAERTEALEFLDAYQAELGVVDARQAEGSALAAFARALFASNEFMHVD
ncbi:MAG: DUF1553 domain-containing protein [Verrucomicrobia bacterium]|nr:DUF1553 domain-containing protein [Verrucomicrobiota bacterium]